MSQRDAQKIDHSQSARVTQCLPVCILFWIYNIWLKILICRIF